MGASLRIGPLCSEELEDVSQGFVTMPVLTFARYLSTTQLFGTNTILD
jgi:hypothetical protein